MYKQIWTLIRGSQHNAAEAFTDRHAILILQQQIRDSARAVAAARKAVAIAMAQSAQEREQDAALHDRIRDLETRAMSAIEQGKTELAKEAAATIAHLEADTKSSREAQTRFDTEIARLKQSVRDAETKLRNLQRGQRLVSATDAAQQMQGQMADDNFSSLAEAEATLVRLQSRQRAFDLTQQAFGDIDQTDTPEKLSAKLAEAGCGEPLGPTTDEVMARLKQRLADKKTSADATQSSTG